MNIEYFIIYDVASGLPTLKGQGRPGIADLQNPPSGMASLELPYETWQLEDYSTDIEVFRTALKAKVKAKREAVINGGSDTPSGRVDTDDVSRGKIAGASFVAFVAKSTSVPFTIEWTMQDNSFQALDADQMIAVGTAVAFHVNAAHDRARALQTELEAAPTVVDLLKIDTAAGW